MYLTASAVALTIYAAAGKTRMADKVSEKQVTGMEEMLRELPDSLYEDVVKEDLLLNETYIKLARDGWSPYEIKRIMDDYLKYNRKAVKGSFMYGMYAKQWLPSYGFTSGGDSIYQYVDTTYTADMVKSVRQLYPKQMSDYYEEIPYTPDDRMNKIRNTGYFRPVQQKPYSGRIHWIVVHPTDPDCLMVIPDGGGIFRTSDLGKTWDCVTDRIPDREFRKIATHSAIPVDPDDWNHFLAFVSGGSKRVYETFDGGKTWTHIEGATHYGLKRGYGFKDAAGNFKVIGAEQQGNYFYNKLWISENKGKNWTQIFIPDSLKETHPETGIKGAFLQNFAFHPTNRNLVFVPASRSIYYFDDGVTKGTDGQYHIKKMRFNVYGQDGKTLRASQTTEFPFKGTTQGFLEVNPNNPDQMWFATASRNVSYGVYSAVYRSDDGGKNWITLQEPMAGIGQGLAFGNESPWGWLGGFGVNFADTAWVYGCSMSSAISSNGGRTFKEYGWPNRLKSEQEDGVFYTVTSARHNADNHCIVSHASGRVFRGSDAGLLMKDKDINNHEWTNINGTMGNQLHYSIKVNEFGDQTMLGNTQDVDVQTYRYGVWGSWRGYEGTEAFINPYAGTCYFSGSGGGSLDNVSLSSWYEGYTWADVCTGNWYLIHNPGNNAMSFFRIEDFGRKTVNLSQNTLDDTGAGTGARDLALTRQGGKTVLFVLNTNSTLVKSSDLGNTFKTVKVQVDGNLVNAKYSGSWITANPEDSTTVYLGQKQKLLKINVETGVVEDLSSGLPNISCEDILYHEGSGDIYFYSAGGGIFLRENGSDTWTMWMKGYNPLASKRVALNYTTQEMVLCDYGRGVWVADLEHPSDRYFSNGFQLKELSVVDGRHTLGIDTKLTIPLYYDYKWTVNGEDVNNPFQYLTRQLNDGDRVRLTLTLRESPDVSTVSSEYVVRNTRRQKKSLGVEYKPKGGSALYSNGSGRVDLGYVDYFFNDFSIDFWVKPESNGVILANRPVALQKDTRGWALLIENGVLKFRMAPANLTDRATYVENPAQQSDLVGGSVEFGKWIHVAVTEERMGQMSIYVNGVRKETKERIVRWAPLNSAVYLSLFADGFESLPIKAAVDELRIWNGCLTEADVQKTVFAHTPVQSAEMVYYNDFNAGNLSDERELFSRQGMKPRTEAVTSYVPMPVQVAANRAAVGSLSGRTAFSDQNETLMYLTPLSDMSEVIGVYRYPVDGQVPGLDETYYTLKSDLFQVRVLGGTASDVEMDLEIPVENKASENFVLYACGLYSDTKIWNKVAEMQRVDDHTLKASGVKLSDLQDKVFIVLRNKPAIEGLLADEYKDNVILLYDSENPTVRMDAKLVGGISEPVGLYKVYSKNGLFKMSDYLKFENGKAHLLMDIDISKLSGKEEVSDTIVGSDGRLIPMFITVKNRMLPAGIGHASGITSGGLVLSDQQVYGQLNGKNTVTMMGWVRIDNAGVLSGVKPMFFFRGGNTRPCGLHLQDGYLRLHWNDGYYGWGTNLNLTTQDLGRWVHLALVVEPKAFRYYMDGVEYKANVSGGVPLAQIASPFLMGQNWQGDKWFSGAFDQVSLWNRSLSAEEVRYYMQHSPKLNEAGLVGYFDMDHTDANGNLVEVISGSKLGLVGTVTSNVPTNVPYAPVQEFVQETADTDEAQMIYLEQPEGKRRRCLFSVFQGVAYNGTVAEHPELYPLLKEHYTIRYESLGTFAADDVMTMTVRLPQINGSDKLVLAIRPLGSENQFADCVEATYVEDGLARFQIPAGLLKKASEFMLMTDASVEGRPVKVELSLAEEGLNADSLYLSSTSDSLRIRTRVISYVPGKSHVEITAVESSYASVDRLQLNLEDATTEEFVVRLDKSAMNKLAFNPVTVRLTGVDTPSELKLNVSLEPIVELAFVNDTIVDGGQITVRDITASVGVDVKVKQGVLPSSFRLQTVMDDRVQAGVNTGVGMLLGNTSVQISNGLDFYEGVAETEEGWNLIGNPYLANVNLTKKQNVVFDESSVVKYLYQYNPQTDTYTAWDMVENYDETHAVSPFQSFFIQTKQKGAKLVITPEAKNTSVNRRVFDHYRMKENRQIRLALVADSGKVADYTEVRIQEDASAGFVLGEDAVKMWGGLNSTSSELATVADGKFMAVQVTPDKQTDIQLALRLRKTGTFSLQTLKLVGFSDDDQIQLVDTKTGTVWNMNEENSTYTFVVDDVQEAIRRFLLRISVNGGVGIDDAETSACHVYVEDRVCHIEAVPQEASIQIFDTVGRRVVYDKAVSDSYSVRLDAGNYVVRVKTENKDYTTKITVR